MTTPTKLFLGYSLRSWVDFLMIASAILTYLAQVPYEKDLLGLFPATWTPWLTTVGGFATGLLAILRIVLKRIAPFVPEEEIPPAKESPSPQIPQT